MGADFSEVFKHSALHLLVWDRLEEHTHREGLRFMSSLIAQEQGGPVVMALLRPAGRNKRECYKRYDFAEETKDPDSNVWDWQVRCPTGCELWLNVALGDEAELWRRLTNWVSQNPASKAWRCAREPVWQPLGRDEEVAVCNGYGAARGNAQQIWETSSASERAWLLKLIWYRASEEISKRQERWRAGRWLNPFEERTELVMVLCGILKRFKPCHYGLKDYRKGVDPFDFGVSHMSCFAVNTVTRCCHVKESEGEPRPCYMLEDYFRYSGGASCTRPSRFVSRKDYLKAVRDWPLGPA